MNNKRGHGSPYDRGSADKYYSGGNMRGFRPHFYKLLPSGAWKHVDQEHMTLQEIEEYRRGWEDETDTKDWGDI